MPKGIKLNIRVDYFSSLTQINGQMEVLLMHGRSFSDITWSFCYVHKNINHVLIGRQPLQSRCITELSNG